MGRHAAGGTTWSLFASNTSRGKQVLLRRRRSGRSPPLMASSCDPQEDHSQVLAVRPADHGPLVSPVDQSAAVKGHALLVEQGPEALVAEVLDHPLGDQEVGQLGQAPAGERQAMVLWTRQRDLLDLPALGEGEGGGRPPR
jgi:hypothetical protein